MSCRALGRERSHSGHELCLPQRRSLWPKKVLSDASRCPQKRTDDRRGTRARVATAPRVHLPEDPGRHDPERPSWRRNERPSYPPRRSPHCAWCGATEKLSIDHIVPRNQGGTDHLSNLRVLCFRCNTRRRRGWEGGGDASKRLPEMTTRPFPPRLSRLTTGAWPRCRPPWPLDQAPRSCLRVPADCRPRLATPTASRENHPAQVHILGDGASNSLGNPRAQRGSEAGAAAEPIEVGAGRDLHAEPETGRLERVR
jgi:5-methylcytosine-specific restriction endonuclease McrA